MYLLFLLFSAAASAVSLYSLLCVVRVIFTWSPDLNYSPLGKLLARICDPWMNAFRRFNFMKNSPVDISPMISIGVLMMISAILRQFALNRRFSGGIIIFVIVQILWSICSSLLTFFNILLAVRLIAELMNRTQSSIWYSIDQVVNPIAYKTTGIFTGRRFVQPKTALGITLACTLILQFGLKILMYRFFGL